jgi:hypothetical protein
VPGKPTICFQNSATRPLWEPAMKKVETRIGRHVQLESWSGVQDLNPRLPRSKRGALFR